MAPSRFLVPMLLITASACLQGGNTDESPFDPARVKAEIDSVMSQLIDHQLAVEFDQFNSFFTTSLEGTVVRDGEFFDNTQSYLADMAPLLSSIDAVSSFEWLHYMVYPLAADAAVFAGHYRELVAMNGVEPALLTGSMTTLFQKVGGAWEMVHVHSSHLP